MRAPSGDEPSGPTWRRASGPLAAAAVCALVLAGCAGGIGRSAASSESAASSSEASTEASTEPSLAASAVATGDSADILRERGYDPADPRAAVEALEQVSIADRDASLVVSVRPTELVVQDEDGRQGTVALPDDAFYLSVAPYRDSTHECYFHSLTTCRGELAGTSVRVVAVADDGTVLVDTKTTTAANGFVGLWLPRDVAGTLTVTVDGQSASTAFATGAEDPTCLTTLDLTV